MRRKRCKWWCCPFGKAPLQLTAAVGAFTGPGGKTIAAEASTLRLVDTVPAVGHLDTEKTLRRWPDILRDLPPTGFAVPPGEVRPLWLTVRVPADAAPGHYEGAVTVSASSGDTAVLPVDLTVHQPVLPNPADWSLSVDFWQSFGRFGRLYNVPEWSDDWWGLVRIFVQDLAEHGESVVQVGRGHFDWRQAADGSWVFGFERFDRYVELCDSVGIDGLIEYLQMFDGRGQTSVCYLDSTGKTKTVPANPGDPAFDELWVAFGKSLAEHCRQKGWLARLYICPTDEPQDGYGQPTLQRFRQCRRLLRQADPALRTTCALDSLKSARALAGEIDRFVFKLREDVYDRAFATELREQGKRVETYICCHPERPNSFITSDAIDQRVIGWICRQEQFEGLLRWSYVNWPPDPFGKPEGDGRYAPGDLFIVYPGDRRPIASTRWERMREGFEDYEMLRVVEYTIAHSRSAQKTAAQEVLEGAMREVAGPPGTLTKYETDPEKLLAARRRVLEAVDGL